MLDESVWAYGDADADETFERRNNRRLFSVNTYLLLKDSCIKLRNAGLKTRLFSTGSVRNFIRHVSLSKDDIMTDLVNED